MNEILITTPIYYVNAKPHIGHAYTTVVCDVYARFYRMKGYNVKFSTGTDEHGKKVEQSAVAKGIKPQAFADEISDLFRNLLPLLNISNTDFIRTTEPRHKKTVQHFWNKLKSNGYIYLGEYKGWYDIRNEAYFSENELIDGKSPLGGEVTYMVEPCYFFKLSAFGDKLLDFYEKHQDFIFPISKRNEIINFVKQGLTDLSISRSTFSWGIPVPDDPKHVVYVWLDALTNYLTINGYPNNEDQNNDPFWQNSVHFVGKEIVRFHAIYWPAFLMAVGINPPKRVVSHGWWLSEGQKMSKSLGNVQDPYKYLRLFGSDALRYFLLRELPFGEDGNFSLKSFVTRYNSVLANSFGNLCSRVLSLIDCFKKLIIDTYTGREDKKFSDILQSYIYNADKLMSEFAFNKALEEIEKAIYLTNQYIDAQKPWKLKDSDPERFKIVLSVALTQIFKISKSLYPVIPDAIEKLTKQLNITIYDQELPKTIELNDIEPLFPRIDSSDLSKFDVYAA